MHIGCGYVVLVLVDEVLVVEVLVVDVDVDVVDVLVVDVLVVEVLVVDVLVVLVDVVVVLIMDHPPRTDTSQYQHVPPKLPSKTHGKPPRPQQPESRSSRSTPRHHRSLRVWLTEWLSHSDR